MFFLFPPWNNVFSICWQPPQDISRWTRRKSAILYMFRVLIFHFPEPEKLSIQRNLSANFFLKKILLNCLVPSLIPEPMCSFCWSEKWQISMARSSPILQKPWNKNKRFSIFFGPLPHVYTNACKQGCVHTLNTTSVCNGALRSHFVKIFPQRHTITQELCLTCFYLKLTSKSQSPLHSELPFPFSVLRQTENNIYLVTNVYPYKQLSATNSAQCSTHIRQI